MIKDFVTDKYNNLKDTSFFRVTSYYVSRLLDKFESDHIWIMSSGISFNFLICLIPFTLILLTILGIYLDSSNVQEKMVNYLNTVVPLPGDYKTKFVNTLVDKTKELTSNTFLTGALGTAGLLWTISGLFSSMREVLRKIFQVKDDVSYLKGKTRDLILVLVSFVLFLLSMSITSSIQVLRTISEELFGKEITFNLIQSVAPIILGFVTSFLLFYLLYNFVPHWKVPKRIILVSATVSTILFEILKFLFAIYILNVASYTRIYGTYATIVISIFWIYYVSTVFVIGAEIGQIYREKYSIKISSAKK